MSWKKKSNKVTFLLFKSLMLYVQHVFGCFSPRGRSSRTVPNKVWFSEVWNTVNLSRFSALISSGDLNLAQPWQLLLPNVMHPHLLLSFSHHTLHVQASPLGADRSWLKQIEALRWGQNCNCFTVCIMYSPVTCSAPSMLTDWFIYRECRCVCVCVCVHLCVLALVTHLKPFLALELLLVVLMEYKTRP